MYFYDLWGNLERCDDLGNILEKQERYVGLFYSIYSITLDWTKRKNQKSRKIKVRL